jgi:hypothetical protein
MAVSESSNLLGQVFLDAIREAVKEAIREVGGNGQHHGLLDPDVLAAQMAIVHSLTMDMAGRLKDGFALAQQDITERALNKLDGDSRS